MVDPDHEHRVSGLVDADQDAVVAATGAAVRGQLLRERPAELGRLFRQRAR